VIDSVVGGAAAGIAGLGLDVGVAWSLVLGCVAFLASMALFIVWARGKVGGFLSGLDPLFPTPANEDSARP
jgi:hypothetical protein